MTEAHTFHSYRNASNGSTFVARRVLYSTRQWRRLLDVIHDDNVLRGF